jgi:hypothetical protein
MSLSPLVLAEVPGVSNSRQDLLMDDPLTLAFSVRYGGADGLARRESFFISQLNLASIWRPASKSGRRNGYADSRGC